MKVNKIVQLESYRGRKDTRLRQTLALHSHDPERAELLRRIWQALALTGADRGAILWLDEYGSGLVHAHSLLDLASDRPRQSFASLPLRGAWDTGVPGLLDIPDAQSALKGIADGVKSVCAVALGSDGPRSWFLCLDSLTPRPALTSEMAGDLMFIAGECAAVILHPDLDSHWGVRQGASRTAEAGAEGQGAFAGWPVLQDVEHQGDDAETSARITKRFLVARTIRSLVEDAFSTDDESLRHQVEGVRREMDAQAASPDPEGQIWERLLVALEAQDHLALLRGVLEWGGIVEGMGHLSGAIEIHALAHELAVALREVEAAVDAARFRGRAYRKMARWDQALRWYGIAEEVAREALSKEKLALVLDGTANTYRDKGSLPRAREILGQVLSMGEAENLRNVQAVGHHDLMTVEKLASNMDRAILHGWRAVQRYESAEERLQALFDLAGVLKENGDYSAARDAYSVVLAQVKWQDYRFLALDALSHLAALAGQAERFEALKAQLDAMGWESAGPVVKGQILYYRGRSHQALGEAVEAAVWMKRALALAERNKLNKLIFDAEAALRELERGGAMEGAWRRPFTTSTSTEPELREVQEGLRQLRLEVVGAGELS